MRKLKSYIMILIVITLSISSQLTTISAQNSSTLFSPYNTKPVISDFMTFDQTVALGSSYSTLDSYLDNGMSRSYLYSQDYGYK